MRRLILVVVVLGLIASIMFVVRLDRPGGGSHDRALGRVETQVTPIAAEIASPATERDRVEVLASDDAVLEIRLRLIDETLGVPVMGEVRARRGDLLGETDGAGRIALVVNESQLATLEFTAVGYTRTPAPPVPDDLDREWLIPMESELSSTVLVVDEDGGLIEGATVRIVGKQRFGLPWFRRPAATGDDFWSHTGVTDESGTFSFSLAQVAVCEVRCKQGSTLGSTAQLQIRPGETARVVLVREPAILRIVDADTGEPLRGFVVDMEDSRDPRQRPVQRTTDENGELPLATGLHELTVNLLDSRRVNASCQPDPRVTSDRGGWMFRFDRLEPGETLTISVECCSVPLRLVDAETGEPLVGWVQLDHERRGRSAAQGTTWDPREALRSTLVLRGGNVDLGCVYLPRHETQRMRLAVKGYRPVWLTPPDLDEHAPRQTIAMERAETLVSVSVHHLDGSPYLGTLRVRNDRSGSRTPNLQTDLAGELEPVHWEGGSMTVFCLQAAPPGEDAAVAPAAVGHAADRRYYRLGSIAAEEVADGRARLTLDFSPRSGQLRVQGPPEGSPAVFAVDRRGFRRKARRVGEEYVLDGLPTGPYFVGTQGWLDGLSSQGYGSGSERLASLVASVTEGQQTVVDWDPRWCLVEPLSGWVDCDPDHRAELALRPWYGISEACLSAYDDTRIYLDEDGRYVIPAGYPRPEVLLVCTSNSSYWIQVLQAFEPGGDTRVPLGCLILEWEGDPPAEGNATVLYMPRDLAFDKPVLDRRPHGYYLAWNTLQPLVLNAVSTAVADVLIDVKGHGRTSFPVVIEEGAETRLTIKASKLLPPPARSTEAHSFHR